MESSSDSALTLCGLKYSQGSQGPSGLKTGGLCLLGDGELCNMSRGLKTARWVRLPVQMLFVKGRERSCMMDPVLLLLILVTSMPFCSAVYSGPLQPEISNGTFHHFFVPDGDYDETEDLEVCQMLFKFSDVYPCGASEEGDSVVRDDFVITKLQAEDAARLLEGIGRTVAHDLDGEDTYGKFLQREISQIGEAFSNVDKSLLELEVKFKQSQET